jgi:hypothetical protein
MSKLNFFDGPWPELFTARVLSVPATFFETAFTNVQHY